MSCSTAAHVLLPNSSKALTRKRAAFTNSSGAQQSTPKQLAGRPRTLEAPPSRPRAFLQVLWSPYDCGPYGLQSSKLTDPQSTEFYPLS